MKKENISKVMDGFIEAMFFTEQEQLEEQNCLEWELSIKAKDEIEDICKLFLGRIEDIVETLDLRQIGHDLWLTTKGHGAGFWDGDYSKEDEKRLMEACKDICEISPYPNHHGFLSVE